MYSHLRPLPLYGCSGCIISSLMPIHKNMFAEFISEQIHAAHVFAPRRIQENTPGELFMYWFRARGYITLQELFSFIYVIIQKWGVCIGAFACQVGFLNINSYGGGSLTGADRANVMRRLASNLA